MGKNRYNNQIPDYTPKANRVLEKQLELDFSACCVCGGKIGYGYYGRHNDGGTCSSACEKIQQAKPNKWGEPSCYVQDAEE